MKEKKNMTKKAKKKGKPQDNPLQRHDTLLDKMGIFSYDVLNYLLNTYGKMYVHKIC